MCHHYPGKKAVTRDQKDALPFEFHDVRIDHGWKKFLEPVDAYPLTAVATLRLSDDDTWLLENRSWGFLHRSWKPGKVKTTKAFQRGKFNARSETIHTTWPWKLAWRQRCVMLASGFCEPYAHGPGEALYTLPGHDLFAIPAIWDRYEGDDGKGETVCVESCVMLTTEANTLVASTRKQTGRGEYRQPVILTEPEDIHRYCSAETSEYSQLADLLRPLPDDQMACDRQE